MVRYAGMSKGCKICRERKIKCDEKLPNCTQCVRGRRLCPGPVDGHIFLFLETDSDASRKRTRRDGVKKSKAVAQTSADGVLANFDRSNLSRRNKNEASNRGRIVTKPTTNRFLTIDDTQSMSSYELTRKHAYQPSIASLFEQHVVAHFISFFDHSPPTQSHLGSWFFLLPSMLSSATRPLVRPPILAASLALYGNLSNEPTIVTEAYKWYGSGLKRQRKRLFLQEPERMTQITPTVEDISMALLLAYFEVVFHTSPEAYFQHHTGASKMLELMGPEACQTGVLHELFQTVRFHMIYVSFFTRQSSIFAADKWLTVPLELKAKSPLDQIVEILTLIPEILSHSETLHPNPPSYTNTPERHPLETSYLIAKLEAVWPQLEELAPEYGHNTSWLSISDEVYPHMLRLWNCTPKECIFLDIVTAITIAFYHLAWLLVLSSLSNASISSGVSSTIYDDLLIAHSSSILSAAAYIDGQRNGCAYIRMVFPLRTVCLNSPNVEQRESARYWLEMWRLHKGMGGICEVALASMET